MFQQYSQVWIQTNSMLLKNNIDGSWKPPWCIADQVEEIMHLLEGCINKVSHIYREGNKLADHLANYVLDFGDIECEEFWQLDIQGRRIVNEDNLLEGKGCQGLRSEEERKWWELESTLDHHVQIPWEENMMINFFTNHFFLQEKLLSPCLTIYYDFNGWYQRLVLIPLKE